MCDATNCQCSMPVRRGPALKSARARSVCTNILVLQKTLESAATNSKERKGKGDHAV